MCGWKPATNVLASLSTGPVLDVGRRRRPVIGQTRPPVSEFHLSSGGGQIRVTVHSPCAGTVVGMEIIGYVITGWVLLSVPATAVAAMLFHGAAVGPQPTMRPRPVSSPSKSLAIREHASV